MGCGAGSGGINWNVARSLQEIGWGDRRVSAEFSAKRRIAARRLSGPCYGPVNDVALIKVLVSDETKAMVQGAAQRELMTSSVWLRRLICAALEGGGHDSPSLARVRFTDGRATNARATRGDGARLYVRLRAEDRLLLRERAAARGMASATYASALVRSHLRKLPPLPKEELLALKRSVAELGAIGRNLNQLARAANQGGRAVGPRNEDLGALLKVCQALRDHVKGTIKANVDSWEIGYAEDES